MFMAARAIDDLAQAISRLGVEYARTRRRWQGSLTALARYPFCVGLKNTIT